MLELNNITYSELLDLRNNKKEKHLPWEFVPKAGCRRFCNFIGVDTVKILREFPNMHAIDLMGLPEKFVLKPMDGHSDAGVMILSNIGGGLYHESFRNVTVSLNDIINIQLQDLRKWKLNENMPYVVEEYIPDIYGDIIPHDFKFFIFQGEVGIIMEVNRNKSDKQKHYFYEPDFSPIRAGRIIGLTDTFKVIAKPKPDFSDKLLNLAKRVSIALPTPFVRVDLYYDGNKAKVGEITLTPHYGFPYKWTKAQDIFMGRMWIDSIHRMNKNINELYY